MSETLVIRDSPATLAIPNPANQPVPPGWVEHVALPAILATVDWAHLDEYEARLRAFASYIESYDGDNVEFEKALRIVEKRRGDMLGTTVTPGARTDLNTHVEVQESSMTMSRWRTIARHWDDLWPSIRDAKKKGEVTQAAVLRRIDAVTPGPPGPLPDGVYRTICADPPWQYGNTSTRGAAEDHYPTMTIEELCAIDVRSMAADESHLYLWTTNGFLREAFDVMSAWGFDYKTTLVWVKPQIGMGNYFRSSTEYVLFGVRGGLRTRDCNQRNWFEAKRGRHSKKPGSFFDLVEKVSGGPFLEMFARERRLSEAEWSYWGNEA